MFDRSCKRWVWILQDLRIGRGLAGLGGCDEQQRRHCKMRRCRAQSREAVSLS